MSAQYCPNCGKTEFVWFIDEEQSPYTQWHCLSCEYHAEEDESLESICNNCKTKNLIYIRSNGEYFKFCTECQNKTKATPWESAS